MSWDVIVEASTSVAAAAALIGWLRWRNPRNRARRLLKDLKESRLADAQDGEQVRVCGVVGALDDTLASPISGRSCVAFHVSVDWGEERGTQWYPGVVDSRYVPFKAIDGGVEARVEGTLLLDLDPDDRGDVWANLPPTVFELLERNGIAIQGWFGGERRFRFQEALLVPGDRITVAARIIVTPDPDGVRDRLRDVPLRYTFRGDEGAPVVVKDADDPP